MVVHLEKTANHPENIVSDEPGGESDSAYLERNTIAFVRTTVKPRLTPGRMGGSAPIARVRKFESQSSRTQPRRRVLRPDLSRPIGRGYRGDQTPVTELQRFHPLLSPVARGKPRILLIIGRGWPGYRNDVSGGLQKLVGDPMKSWSGSEGSEYHTWTQVKSLNEKRSNPGRPRPIRELPRPIRELPRPISRLTLRPDTQRLEYRPSQSTDHVYAKY